MTLAEQREKLIELLDDAIGEQWYPAELLATISAAGFSIVGPEVTDGDFDNFYYAFVGHKGGVKESLKAGLKNMLACTDLGRKPE